LGDANARADERMLPGMMLSSSSFRWNEWENTNGTALTAPMTHLLWFRWERVQLGKGTIPRKKTSNQCAAVSGATNTFWRTYDLNSKNKRRSDQKAKALKKKIEESTPTSQPVHVMTSIKTPWVRQFLASCPRDVLLPFSKDYCFDNFNSSLLAPAIERYCQCIAINNQ
jgi:hypothetical protein